MATCLDFIVEVEYGHILSSSLTLEIMILSQSIRKSLRKSDNKRKRVVMNMSRCILHPEIKS